MDGMQKERFHRFIADYLREECDVKDVVAVSNVAQEHYADGYCETCYHEWDEVDVTYVALDGTTRVYNYYGSISEMLGFSV